MKHEEAIERIKEMRDYIIIEHSPNDVFVSRMSEAIKDLERPRGEWIPITFRPMDEEEYEDFKKEFGELPVENRKMFSCQMPEDDQEILICTSWGRVSLDRCVVDEYGYGLEENGDWDGIVAWMPLPEPYKEGEAE